VADASKLFVISAISRKGIAEDLNDWLEIREFEQHVADDDDRLTDAICTAYAAALGEIDPDLGEDWETDEVDRIQGETLKAIGIEYVEEDE
jgi:hypothetical protein